MRWKTASKSLKQEEKRSRRKTFIIVAGQLALAATLATTSQPLYVWLILILVATTTITTHIQNERSKKRELTEELKQETKLIYAAYFSMFKSIKTKGNSTVTAEECANLMTAAIASKTSLLGKVWSNIKPPIPMSREETAVRRIVTLSPEELTDLIHRILTTIVKETILPHLPSKTVNLIIDGENVAVTGKKLIRRAADYVVGTHKANHTLPYLRISILPQIFTSPAFPIYITILKREESPIKHVLRVVESLKELGLKVGEAYVDSNLASTSLFLTLKEAGITLVARLTKSEPIKEKLTPHLKLEELKAIVNQFSDTLERRIREVEDPRTYLQAKRHILRGNLAVLGKALAHLATIDQEFVDIKEKFEAWMKSLPPAFFWTHIQRSKKDRRIVRLSVGCVTNSTYQSTLKALSNPEAQGDLHYLRKPQEARHIKKTVKDQEFSPLIFYSGFATPLSPQDAYSRVWEFSLITLGLKRSQIETEIRESRGFALECKSTNIVFRLLVKGAAEIANLCWRAVRIREAGFKIRTEKKFWKADMLILREREGKRKRRGGEEKKRAIVEETPPQRALEIIKTGCVVKIRRFAEKPLPKSQFKKDILQENYLFLLVGLGVILSSKPPPAFTKPPPQRGNVLEVP